MQRAAQLREQIETSLGERNPGALSPRIAPELPRTPCEIPALDEVLQGGIPMGGITEFVGPEGSGRTTMALAYVSAIVRGGGVCAWIDVADSLDPESMAASGVDLDRLLWVRCGVKAAQALSAHSTSAALPEMRHDAMVSTSSSAPLGRHTGGGSPHPRSEGRDMPQAISALMAAHGGLYDKQVRREKRAIGTPGAPNRPLTQRSEHREEQVNSDRLPPRRGDNLAVVARCAEPQPRRVASLPSCERLPSALPNVFGSGKPARKPWPVLDQALRAADLLLQGGGFSAIVLDLGSTPPEAAWRIPLATWFRFRAACERTRVSLILLTQHPCSRSSAEVAVRLESGSLEADSRVMTGIRYQAATQRSRTRETEAKIVPIRKPPKPVSAGAWRSEAAWAHSK